jgi:large subunit ribosomal protein L32
MAVPKRKVSKSAKKMRRSHLHLAVKSPSVCPNCDNSKLPHRICPHCGYYDGKEIVTAKE